MSLKLVITSIIALLLLAIPLGAASKRKPRLVRVNVSERMAMSDSLGPVSYQPCSSPPPPALRIVQYPAPYAYDGVPYSSCAVASGGVLPYTWSLSGYLPPGLTLAATTGCITGTPMLQCSDVECSCQNFAPGITVSDAAGQVAH